MKKTAKPFCLVLSLLLILTIVSPAHANAAFKYDGWLPPTVRVGLTSKWADVWSIPIDSPALTFDYMPSVTALTAGIGGYSPVLERRSAFSLVPTNDAFVLVAQAYTWADADAAAQDARAQGLKAAPVFGFPSGWAVYAYGFGSSTDARDYATATHREYIPGNTRRVMLMDGGDCAVIFENESVFCAVADARTGETKIGDRTYRGFIEANRETGGKLTAVNVVSFQDYLRSVVPSEMPASWSAEALKAQAVACRCYTLDRWGVHAEDGYDLCDGTHCQSYAGSGQEHENSNAAVETTDGYLIYYDGKPINAVYFSSSGGYTDDSENVWSGEIPYLRCVADNYEYEPKEWTRSFTYSELTEIARAKGESLGAVTGVTVEKAGNGRVSSMTIKGTGGNKILYKEEIRTFFSASQGGSLESRNFSIQNGYASEASAVGAYVSNGASKQYSDLSGVFAVNSTGAAQSVRPVAAIGAGGTVSLAQGQTMTATGDGVTFVGRGWGHGVGMSQRGAEGLARQGYDFIQILRHYYTGTVVAK